MSWGVIGCSTEGGEGVGQPASTPDGGTGTTDSDEQAAMATPHIRYADVSKRGYVVLDLTRERTQAAWYLYTVPEQPSVTEAFAQAYAKYDGENRLRKESSPAPDGPSPPAAPA